MTKVIIITGAGHGIGAACAHHLLAKNMRVVIAEKNVEHKKQFSSSNALFIQTDVTSEQSIKKMVQSTIKHFGQIDSLINNAGLLPTHTPFEKLDLKNWNAFLSTNLTGPFLCTKHTLPHLKKQNGTVVNIASTRALQSEGEDEAYSATKGGLVAFTHALAVSLGPKIRVNCVSPGWIDTQKEPLKSKDHKQHPAGRVGIPEDVASLVAFLISDEAAFITGQNFIIDGGMTIKMIYN